MQPSTLLFAVLSLGTAALAAPAPAAAANEPSPFYLVTTTQQLSSANSSALPSVSATSLFDPLFHSYYSLRLLAPGYASLPTFTLSSGTLHTFAAGPHGFPASEEFNSTFVAAGAELAFAAAAARGGTLGLRGGYLLTVGGMARGWTLCPGELEQVVLDWRGNATGCVATFVHAVGAPPY